MVIHMVEYYSALKRKEVLTPATMWMNLGDMKLSEITQTQKDTHCLIPLPGGPRGVRCRDRKWMVGPGAGGGVGSQCVWGLENAWKDGDRVEHRGWALTGPGRPGWSLGGLSARWPVC